jgi:D-xylose transport system substrate-binding protein
MLKLTRSNAKILTIAMIFLAFILSACVQAQPAAPAAQEEEPAAASEESAAPAEQLTIGVAMRTETQPRWRFDVASMEQRAEELGNIELLVQWPADDPILQTSQVENLLTQGIDALIIVPVDDRAVIPLVDKAHEVGVPILAYDVAIPDADVDYFLTRDNREVGRLQVQGALDFAPPNADDPPKYALIKGDPGNNVARELAEVYEQMLQPLADAGEIELVADQWHENWSGELALKTVENALAANDDDVQAFITSNDSMAVGVAQGVQGRGLEGKVYISGLDADVANDRLIVEGVIERSIWTRIDEMGRRAVDAAVALAQDQEAAADGTTNNGFKDVPSAFIAVEAVTADNMCQWITQGAPEGWVTIEDVYVDVPVPEGCEE